MKVGNTSLNKWRKAKQKTGSHEVSERSWQPEVPLPRFGRFQS